MFDVAIIGAGPIGLFGIFQAGMMGLNTVVIETLPQVGGQCQALYPEKPIYDIPAFPIITAQELVNNLHQQALPFHPTFLLNQRAISVLRNDDQSFSITTSDKHTVKAKSIIIAAGGGSFEPNKPAIHNIEKFEKNSVIYSINDQKMFSKKNVVIAGGGDSAIDWALLLSDITSHIYLVHRREKFRASPENLRKLHEKVAQNKISVVTPYQLHSLSGANEKLEYVDLIDLESNIMTIKADYLLPFFGLSMNIREIADWGLEMEGKHIKVNIHSMQTNIKGIFAVGDIASYDGKLKLILTGFSEVALACNKAYSFINGNAEMHFEYSTTKGIPSI